MARTVRRQRPQSDPAPQASATCRDVLAPAATASCTAWVVAPVHRQTNIVQATTLVTGAEACTYLLPEFTGAERRDAFSMLAFDAVFTAFERSRIFKE